MDLKFLKIFLKSVIVTSVEIMDMYIMMKVIMNNHVIV